MMKRKYLLPLFLAALLFTAFALLLSSCDSGTADGDKEPDDGYLKEGTRFFYMEATVVNPPEDEETVLPDEPAQDDGTGEENQPDDNNTPDNENGAENDNPEDGNENNSDNDGGGEAGAEDT